MRTISFIIVPLLIASTWAMAGEADILGVEVVKTGQDTFSFSVTVEHADSGWDHYANKWEILGPDSDVLGTRTLYHPHVEEQPFTRSLAGISIPSSILEVTVRAQCTVHGYGGKTLAVRLPH